VVCATTDAVGMTHNNIEQAATNAVRIRMNITAVALPL
jgi:hypothetical protein